MTRSSGIDEKSDHQLKAGTCGDWPILENWPKLMYSRLQIEAGKSPLATDGFEERRFERSRDEDVVGHGGPDGVDACRPIYDGYSSLKAIIGTES